MFCFFKLSKSRSKVNPDCLLFSQRERESPKSSREGGVRSVRWCWVNFQCRGVLLIWIIVRQGPIALAVGAGRDVWTVFLSSVFSFSLFGRCPDLD